MHRLLSIPSLMVFFAFATGCGPKRAPDFQFIDEYLATWDRFARGDNSLISRLNRDVRTFQQHLTEALRKGDNRAPSRVVFYAVVQVGGFISLASPLGQAFHERIGDEVPVFTSEKDGSQGYFAGDLYFWWEAHKSEYASFPLYLEWTQREFAQTVAIKMYESAAKAVK